MYIYYVVVFGVYVCVCVCMCACVYVCACVHVCMCVHVCVLLFFFMHVYCAFFNLHDVYIYVIHADATSRA